MHARRAGSILGDAPAAAMLRCEDELSILVTIVFLIAAAVSCIGGSISPVEEEHTGEIESDEVAGAVAAVQLWLCMICACQVPLVRPFRRARRRAWHAFRSPVISITLLTGVVISLPARKLIGKERLRAMWSVITGARAAEHRARAAERAQAREASRFHVTRAWFNEQFGSWQLGLSVGTRAFLALLLMLSAEPLGQAMFNVGQQLATPSQFATSPFAMPAMHSAHIAVHHEETKLSALAKLLAVGPSYFDSCSYCIRPISVPPLPVPYRTICP